MFPLWMPPSNFQTSNPLIIEAQREIANSSRNITIYHVCIWPWRTYPMVGMACGRIYGKLLSTRLRTKMRVESGLLPRGTTRKILISHYLLAAYVLLAYFALAALYLARLANTMWWRVEKSNVGESTDITNRAPGELLRSRSQPACRYR